MRLVVLLLLLVGLSAHAEPTPIPEFTPNVVDPGHVLDAAGSERVDAEIQRIRDASKIWGAVYIVDTLGDESIEELAVRAFEKWKLGQAGVDNGLLLVLAMKDRRSRFEVGYGLEGTITDVAALHALDAYLAPRMREGDVAGAIVDAFGYLSRVVEQDPVAVQELAEVSDTATLTGEEEDWDRGLRAWGLFLIPVWLAAPLRKMWVGRRRRRLFEDNPTLALRVKDDEVANADVTGGASWKGTVGICAFLTVNPGVFVFLLSSLERVIYYGSIAASIIVAVLIVFLSGRKYASPERYQKHLDDVIKQRTELMGKGHLVQNTSGAYSYTPAYHASRRSSSSSSSSSRSSSSGGGRSGGGGASSGW